MKENNKLIAEFIGVKPKDKDWYDGYELHKAGLPFAYGAMGNGTNDLKFYESWDWLMPVVDKIDKLVMRNKDWFMVSIGSFHTSIFRKNKLGHPYFDEEINIDVNDNKLLRTYKAVVEFIKWYNKNKK